MSNVIPLFPKKPELVKELSKQDKVTAISCHAFGAFVVSLDDDRVDYNSVAQDVEVMRNLMVGLAERSQGITSWRTKILDALAKRLY